MAENQECKLKNVDEENILVEIINLLRRVELESDEQEKSVIKSEATGNTPSPKQKELANGTKNNDLPTTSKKMLSSRKMSNEQPQHSEEKLKNFPQEDAAEKRHNILVEILAGHKVLLDTIVKQLDLMEFFPIDSEEKLREFDDILKTDSEPYIRKMKLLLGGNAQRNLHEIFSQNIIMNFNVDGKSGKQSLRNFSNVFKAIIDVISTFNGNADKTLREAFQCQKQKYNQQIRRRKTENNDREDDDSPKED